MYFQTFEASWPDVLHDMLEYVKLTQLAVGHGRRTVIHVAFSRKLLRPDQLQPHVQEFVANLERIGGQIVVGATEGGAHRIDISYGALS